MKRGTLVLLVCITLATVFLIGLGTWQLQRLQWKEAMIMRVEEGLKQEPVSIETIEALSRTGTDIEYRPSFAEGHFLHEYESHFFATHEGQAGYFVYTPLVLENDRLLLVNRGFVPMRLKARETRRSGLIGGRQKIVGLARSAPEEKPNSFVPDNDVDKNVFHWKSLDQMVSRLGADAPADIVPVFLDADATPVPGDWPIGGVTRISFPNNHLQYAITWFGLAAALVVIGGLFVRSRWEMPR